MLSESLLDQTCDVEQVTNTRNASGGVIKGYSTRLDDVACSLMARSQMESDELGKRSIAVMYRFYFAATTETLTIAYSDRIVFNGENYQVHSIYNVAGKGVLMQVDCLRME